MSVTSSPTTPTIDVETIYTTAAAQSDATDWLTVVKNLRQSNRKLLQQVTDLEEALAKARQECQQYRERSHTQEAMASQSSEENIQAQAQVSHLFQQLEQSHQIAQSQQLLVEKSSQQVEIARGIIAELEAENEHLKGEYSQQGELLTKTQLLAKKLQALVQQQRQLIPNPSTIDVDDIVAHSPARNDGYLSIDPATQMLRERPPIPERQHIEDWAAQVQIPPAPPMGTIDESTEVEIARIEAVEPPTEAESSSAIEPVKPILDLPDFGRRITNIGQ
jgi:myosin heavy subunit